MDTTAKSMNSIDTRRQGMNSRLPLARRLSPVTALLWLALLCLCAVPAWPADAAAVQTEGHPVGTRVSLVATIDAAPTPLVQWFKDGKKIGESLGRPLTPTNAGPGLEYLIELGELTRESAGSYTVTATNTVGTATSDPFVLTITSAPTKPTIRVIAVKPSQVTVEVQKGTRVITK